ncbi:MAG: hypothetical protein P9L99_09535 [Candidatus Lernaella stagnicola]|nr:hypothetical protein [Candidatus Lernaella stagnicola]
MILACVVSALLVVGCRTHVRGVALELETTSIEAMRPLLKARLDGWREVESSVKIAGLWEHLPLPAEDVAVIGYQAAPGPWRYSAAHVAGKIEGRGGQALSKRMRRRLEKYLEDSRLSADVYMASEELRERVLALHVTRGLATNAIGKFEIPVVFARLNAPRQEDNVYAANAVNNIVFLARRKAVGFVWLRDANSTVLWTNIREPGGPWTQERIVQALASGKE